MITIIIPTIGRSTLIRSLNSLQSQSDPEWKAIVVFDGIEPTISINDERITIIKIKKIGWGHSAGAVRNAGIKIATTEWIGFLDDDDIFTPDYISTFKKEKKDNDVIIFRMKTKNGEIIPAYDLNEIIYCNVGISYCFKRNIFTNDNIVQRPSGTEDFDHLTEFKNHDKKIYFSNEITYLVRP